MTLTDKLESMVTRELRRQLKGVAADDIKDASRAIVSMLSDTLGFTKYIAEAEHDDVIDYLVEEFSSYKTKRAKKL